MFLLLEIDSVSEIRNLLNGKTDSGEKLRDGYDFKTPRYLLILYFASEKSAFIDIQKEELHGACSQYSLSKVAKILGLDFDRTKTSHNIFSKQINKGNVQIFTSKDSNISGYKLTKKGIKFVVKLYNQLSKINIAFTQFPDDIDIHTKKHQIEHEKYLKHLDTLSDEERINKVIRDSENSGESLFAQPSEIEILFHEYNKLLNN